MFLPRPFSDAADVILMLRQLTLRFRYAMLRLMPLPDIVAFDITLPDDYAAMPTPVRLSATLAGAAYATAF